MKRIEYKMEKYTMENLEQFFRYFLYDNKLAIGQIFMINANSICKWTKKTKNGYYYNEYDVIDSKQSDVYFVVKYIGNGYIQEMLTGETMLLRGIHNFECEDKPNELVAVNECTNVLSSFEDYKNNLFEKSTIAEYIYKLELYKKLATKSPLICDANIGHSMFKINDASKTVYLKYSNEKRIALIKRLKGIALLSSEEVVEDIDKAMKSYNSISNEILDMAYLENEIYDFEHKERTK